MASSALLAVTTEAPDSMAASTNLRATPVPPISSMTMSELVATLMVSVEAGDAGQLDRSSDTCGKLVLLLDQQACGLGTNGTCAQQSNANRRNIFLCQGILP